MKEAKTLKERYRIIEQLGSGGMSKVYLAEDIELGRKVAIKVLNSKLARDSVFVERFKREARAAANLSHPNIVSVFDWGKESDNYFIVMEVLGGMTIKQLISERGKFSEDEAIDIAVQICSALGYAHENNIIHRDIKPNNIFIDKNNHVKVTDFGIARMGTDDATMTQAGVMMGTPQYFSPEQAQGNGVDIRSDLYSLGVTMYEMITGSVPFEGENLVAIAYKHVHEHPQPPKELRGRISDSLNSIILKLLQKDPEARYQNTDELAYDLKRCKQGLAVASDETLIMPSPLVEKDSAPENGKPKKKKVLPWVILVILLAIIGSAIGYNVYKFTSPEKIELPDVTQMKVDEAKKILNSKGFMKISVSKEESREVPEGVVIDQDPEANTFVPKNTMITLNVSDGLPKVMVPDVREMSEAAAANELGRFGLRIGEISYGFSENYKKDEVIDQNPKPRTYVEQDATVDLVLNRDPEIVKVPNLVGMSLDKALKELSNLGLNHNQTEEFNDATKGTVTNQNPSSGTEIKKGHTVNIVVSKGPNEITLPNFYKRPENVAKSDLSNLGLVANVIYRETDAYKAKTVITQDPAPGSLIKPGETVTLIVAKGKPESQPTPTSSAEQ